MKHNYSFFSQSICTMGACGQCSGTGSTLYKAIRNFNSQKECLLVNIEYILNGGLDK